MKNKFSIFTTSSFRLSFVIFVSYIFSTFLTFLIAFFCYRLGLVPEKINPLWPIIIILLSCTIISFIVTAIRTKAMTKTMNIIHNDLKKIANGNFSTKIDVKINNIFLQNIVDNINMMIDELNSITLLKQDFVTNFSHEFKTPIVSIKGFSELLLEDTNLTEDQRKYLTIIKDESSRLSDLAISGLFFSKLDSQKIVIDKEDYYLDEQIEECILLFSEQFKEKNIDVEVDLKHHKFNGSKELIKNVWINILNNAIKYTNNDGTVKIISSEDSNHFTISFVDNGIGMDNETKKHIFDKFYQADSSSLNHGIGLGLSICKKVVELHNGEITVNSELDKGTVFNIILPNQPIN